MLPAAAIATGLLAVATLLPFLPVAHGIARVGDFPRQQILSLAVLLLLASVVFSDGHAGWLPVQLVLAAVVAVQAWFVVPYTRLWRRETADHDPRRDKGEAFRLIACNVKQSNDRYEALAGLIELCDPDIIVLMEVDGAWMEALGGLFGRYPHVVALPQDNSFGMALASRLKLHDVETNDLLTEGIPSIVATVETAGGQRFRLYSIHPEPPVPHRGSEGRDGETSLVALKAREETLPVLVTGDLNDVAWSRTTRRFRRVSRLLDPRIGRTVFSTFDARYPLIRWPLDHLFHSPRFRLGAMKRLPPCGSDHFPVLFDLVLCPDPDAESEPEQADAKDLERARDLVGQARSRDEKPIGGDWES